MGCVTFGCCNAYRIPLALGLDLKKEVGKTIEDWRVGKKTRPSQVLSTFYVHSDHL